MKTSNFNHLAIIQRP